MQVESGKKIILFDGVCNLCNGAVQWVIKRDQTDVFRFAPLQSAIAEDLLKARRIDTSQMDSIVFIDPGMAYFIKSDAALEIARNIKGYGWAPAVFGWIPRSVRDGIYDLIAKNRYRFFGKKEQCMIPSAELNAKFLQTS
ncbi:thiol-disulfide oxidoreductase DCC family protein [Robiginitalea sp.]|uniref:thiol-disulfide oxidoreductase DCC family protein n=1 Tax=Robiginitalea sp. TaxID=1902411 RepID=UPI003C79517A